ncbi:MAG: hypothetical protein HY288_03740 [Planctomycetia bacterium]|nr:hypothetical protein [Planctomycetia bacterium]
MSTSPDQVSLTTEQRKYLARVADATGRPWADILAEALSLLRRVKLSDSANGESVYDAMVRLGLLGSVKGCPPDLSTNPKSSGHGFIS